MNTKNTKNWKTFVSVLLAVGLLAAACGTSDTAAANTSADTTVTEAAENDTAEGDATDASADEVDAKTDADAGSSESAASDGYLGSYTLDDEEFGTQVTVTVDGSTRLIETNALPDHETGEFPNGGNPNTISAQDLSYEYTTEPVYAGAESFARTPGVAVNGVKFEPATAETVDCASGESFRVEALQDIYDLGLDFNNAHVQPTGEYHYHGLSELLAAAYATDDDLVHVGFAADGFLIYYSKSGAYESGFELTSVTRVGTDCVGSRALGGEDTVVEGTTPDGTYTSDWLWSDEAGDLDACNGTEIDGTYAYVMTNEYPFIGRCLNGESEAAGGPPPGGQGGAAPAGQGAPDLSDAAATLGVTEEALLAVLDGPGTDLDAAADALGVSVEDLMAALPAPGQ